MEGKYIEIYNYLSGIDKLNANIYSRLLSVYGEELVNKVIEQMMEEDSKNLSKFDYYVSKIIAYDDMVSKNIFDLYGIDLSLVTMLTREENIELATEISSIVKEIKNLFEFDNDEDEKNFDKGWIRDNVNKFMIECDDRDKLDELKKLYNKFLDKRNRLVEGNLRLVILIAKKFDINETTFTESIQLGNMGLMRAVEKFSPSFNVTFATYAYYWIKQAITRGIYDVIYPYSIPAYQVGVYYRFRKIQKELSYELGRDASDEEIANRLNVSVDKVKLLQVIFNDPISLYETYGTEDEKDTMLIEFIEDENSSVSKNLDYLELSIVMDRCMDLYLTENEKLVLKSRFGFKDGKCDTLEVVGQQLGCTRERVRQIETKALRKLNVRCGDLKEYI